MGIQTAMNTAISGLNASSTQLEVSGNNLANAQTVGFKSSEAVFATQFARTVSQGSGPSDNDGGTNPLQIGMGVLTAEVSRDFSQGSIEISSSPSDLAIEGNGFFIVEGAGGDQLYTRNGIFRTNAANELVTVTGERVLGYGINDQFEIQETGLVPLTIPLGSVTVTQETNNVFLEGNLATNLDLADTAEVIDSVALTDAVIPRPDINDPSGPMRVLQAATPDISGTTTSQTAGATSFVAGEQYEYTFTFIDSNSEETMPSVTTLTTTIAASGNDVVLNALPASPTTPSGGAEYAQLAIYRRKLGVPASDPEADFQQIGTAAPGAASFTDSALPIGAALDDTGLTGTYSYVVTFSGSGVP